MLYVEGSPISLFRFNFLLILSIVLVGCGGGGGLPGNSLQPNLEPIEKTKVNSDSTNEGQDTQPEPTGVENEGLTLRGMSVKGPLAFASLTVYALDSAFDELYDASKPIAVGQTNEKAQITDIRIPTETSFPVVVVVSAEDAIDLNSNTAPVITHLTTIVTREMLESEQEVYITPLTTLAVDITKARVTPNQGVSNLLAELDRAATLIKTTLGLGIPDKVNIFTDSPVLTRNTTSREILQNTVQHRATLESVAAIVHNFSQTTGKHQNTILAALAKDMSDDTIDDRYNNESLGLIDPAVTLQDPANLYVPNTNVKISETHILMESESSELNNTTVQVPDDIVPIMTRTKLAVPEQQVDNTIDQTTNDNIAEQTNPISRSDWTVKFVDSEEPRDHHGFVNNAFDGDPTSLWHTEWSATTAPLPHELQIDLGDSYDITGFSYLPRQDTHTNGIVTAYEFYLSSDGQNWGLPVASGAFAGDHAEKHIQFEQTTARYARFVALDEINGNAYTSVAELNIFGTLHSDTNTAHNNDTATATTNNDEPATNNQETVNTQPEEVIVISNTTDDAPVTDTQDASAQETNVDPAVDSPNTAQLVVRTNWTVQYVDSEEPRDHHGFVANAFDGDPTSLWHTEWSATTAVLPHEIQIDLSDSYDINGFSYLPRQDNHTNGIVTDYAFYVSDNGQEWGPPVASGTFASDHAEKVIQFEKITARYVRFVALGEVNNNAYTSVAEFNLLGTLSNRNDAPNGTILSPETSRSIETGNAIDFRAAASDPENDSITYNWNFNGATIQSSAEQNPGLVQFNTAGTYNVTLSTQDAHGNSDPTPASITIQVNEPVTVEATSDILSDVQVPPLSKDDPVDWTNLIANASGNTYIVSSASEFNDSAAVAQPGDVILISPGSYDWSGLTIPSNGTEDNPIVYTALKPGTVTFNNPYTLFKVYGNWNIIGGFTVNDNRKHVFYMVSATDNRITDIVFDGPGQMGGYEGYIEIRKRSSRNRIDHNKIYNQKAPIRILLDSDAVANGPSQDTRIDHNLIQGANPGSHYVNIVQIGQGNESVPGSHTLDARMVFEFNEVLDYFGETSQLFNNKSEYNVYRYNQFVNCQGGIGLRQGNHNLVYGNYFERCGNVMVKGEYNIIFNNVFVDAGAIYESMWGERPLSGAPAPATGYNIIAYNTHINPKKYGLRLGFSSGGSDDPVYNSIYANNILVSSDQTLFSFSPSGCNSCTITNNLYYAYGTGKLGSGFEYDTSPIVGNPNLNGFVPTSQSHLVIDSATEIEGLTLLQDYLTQSRDGTGQNDLGAIELK
jgi:hypothetical protein